MKGSDSCALFLTARDTNLRLSQVEPTAPPAGHRTLIHLDERRRYQRIEGFGASFTEAAAIAAQSR